MERLEKLKFEPSPGSRAKASAWRIVGLVLLTAAGALLLIVLFNNLFSGSAFVVSSILTIISSIVFISLVILLSRSLAFERQVAIRDGAISLAFPIRRRDGSRTRQVPMSDIADVRPSLGRGGESGVDVLLSDGSRFFLAQSSFGAQGKEILEALCQPFDHSYTIELREILLNGEKFGFLVLESVEVKEGSILLSRKVNTYSGKSLRKVPFEEIQELEEVSPPYARDAILVTLVDGTQFILREPQTIAASLGKSGALAGKFRVA